MKLKIKPIVKTFELQYDVEGTSTVSIRQIKTADLVRLGDLFSEQTQIWNDEDYGQVQLKRKWNPEELKQERSFCTLVGADLTNDDTGESLFKFRDTKNGPELSMTRGEFIEAWGQLPPELTSEIYRYVVEANPAFDPNTAGE